MRSGSLFESHLKGIAFHGLCLDHEQGAAGWAAQAGRRERHCILRKGGGSEYSQRQEAESE